MDDCGSCTRMPLLILTKCSTFTTWPLANKSSYRITDSNKHHMIDSENRQLYEMAPASVSFKN